MGPKLFLTIQIILDGYQSFWTGLIRFIFFRYSPVKGYDPIESQRRLERYAIDHQGYAAPYAETQLTREEFSEMFGVAQQKYQKLREELDCEKAFPHVYEKISKLGRS